MAKKYIDAEKLKAEIERQIALICTTEGVVQRDKLQEYEALRDIGDFITSLQQEQPEVDLEKEIDKFLNETGAPYVWCNDDEQKEWCNIIARHFYDLGLNARKEE